MLRSYALPQKQLSTLQVCNSVALQLHVVHVFTDTVAGNFQGSNITQLTKVCTTHKTVTTTIETENVASMKIRMQQHWN